MTRTINTKELRCSLPDVVRRVRRGERFIVLYRSRPAFRLVPFTDEGEWGSIPPLAEEPLYRADPVGASTDGKSSDDHDELLYGERRQ